MATEIYISWEDKVQLPLGPVTGGTVLQIFLSRLCNPNYIYSTIPLACPKIISLVLPFIMMSSLFIAHMEVIFPFSQSPTLFICPSLRAFVTFLWYGSLYAPASSLFPRRSSLIPSPRKRKATKLYSIFKFLHSTEV